MIVKGMIADIDDIAVDTRVYDGQAVKTGIFKLMTKKPTAVIDVKLSPDQLEAGVVEQLKKLEGKSLDWQLDFRAGAFGDGKNQHRQFHGFRLFQLPEGSNTTQPTKTA